MSASDLPYALHGLLIVAVLLLAFHLGWRRYAIDRGQGDVRELRDSWWDLITSNPEWHRNAACRAFTGLLERLVEGMPKCSLGLALLTVLVTRSRGLSSSNVSEAAIASLPTLELRLRARAILDAALLSVGATMLRQSFLALSLTLLLLPFILTVMLAITVVRQGRRGLASLPGTMAHVTQRFVMPALGCACTVDVSLATRESMDLRPVLRVVGR